MKAAFKGLGFPTLPSVYFDRNSFFADEDKYLDMAGQVIGYPAIVKPANLGSSIGITMAHDRDELKKSALCGGEF